MMPIGIPTSFEDKPRKKKGDEIDENVAAEEKQIGTQVEQLVGKA